MFLNIPNRLFLSFLCLFLIKCENELINLDSNQIITDLDVAKFDINPENSHSFKIPLDSLDISTSPRLYAFSNIEEGISSTLLLNLNLLEVHEESACQSDSISSVKVELSSLNQLIKKEAQNF